MAEKSMTEISIVNIALVPDVFSVRSSASGKDASLHPIV
jgi:hypothetical protein